MSVTEKEMSPGAKQMTDGTNIYDAFADLLEYPDTDWESKMATFAENDLLDEFRFGFATLTLSELQELYTRTFDLNPVCALEIGYHLFGENYKRGQFLANLRETEAPFELGQENQLPDYLPVLLRLLTKLEDEELRTSLIGECLVPAIDKMLKSLKETENPYRFLLEALRKTLRTEVPAISSDAPRFNMRAHLPVLSNDGDLLSGPAAGGAVAAVPHRDHPLQFDWGSAPDIRGTAPDSKACRPEGHRPSAHQAAEPQTEFAQR